MSKNLVAFITLICLNACILKTSGDTESDTQSSSPISSLNSSSLISSRTLNLSELELSSSSGLSSSITLSSSIESSSSQLYLKIKDLDDLANDQDSLYSEEDQTLACAERVYKTTIIGEQVWMAENLAYLPLRHGESFPSGTWVYEVLGQINYNPDDQETLDAVRLTDDYERFGTVYNWFAAMQLDSMTSDNFYEDKQHQGVCPNGWYLPSLKDWDELAAYVSEEHDLVGKEIINEAFVDSMWGMSNQISYIGLAPYLKHEDFGENPFINSPAYNTYGLSVKAGATSAYRGEFTLFTSEIWSSSILHSQPFVMIMKDGFDDLQVYNSYTSKKKHVRCVKG